MYMRILVTGSRDWEGPAAEAKVGQVLKSAQMLAEQLGYPLTVVHGGCPTGADAIADRWARRREREGVFVETLSFPQWGRLTEGVDIFVGFWREGPDSPADVRQMHTFAITWEDVTHE
jgi:YspA, cpYpsA-related SLOG family